MQANFRRSKRISYGYQRIVNNYLTNGKGSLHAIADVHTVYCSKQRPNQFVEEKTLDSACEP